MGVLHIKLYLKENGWDFLGQIYLALSREQWSYPMNNVMGFRPSKNAGNILTILANIIF